jgi:hypothetical protein
MRVQAQLAGNAAQHNDSGKTPQPSLLAGMLFDGDGNRMTPSHAVKKGTRYRYYVSRSLITKDRTENSLSGPISPALPIASKLPDLSPTIWQIIGTPACRASAQLSAFGAAFSSSRSLRALPLLEKIVAPLV